MQKVTGAYGASSASVGDFATPWRLFQTLYSQQTGATPFISDDGTKLTVNEDIANKTLAYIQKLSKTNLLVPTADYAGAETLMFTGKAGFYFEGPWEITTAQGIQGLKFGDRARSPAVRQGRRASRLARVRAASNGANSGTVGPGYGLHEVDA